MTHPSWLTSAESLVNVIGRHPLAALVVLFVLRVPFTMRSTRERREREEARWTPLSAAASARGWRAELRPRGERLAPGLHVDYSIHGRPHWRIRGEHAGRPWVLDRVHSESGSGAPVRMSFRALLPEAPAYGLRAIGGPPPFVLMKVPASAFANFPVPTRLSPEEMASLTMLAPEVRCDAPAPLARAGYTVALAKDGRDRARRVLEQVAEEVAAWDALHPQSLMDLAVSGTIVQVDATCALDDIADVDRFLTPCLAFLTAAATA